MDKKEIKKKIEDYEYYANGFQRLAGASVKATNIRIKEEKIIADVTLKIDDTESKYRNCEYPVAILKTRA